MSAPSNNIKGKILHNPGYHLYSLEYAPFSMGWVGTMTACINTKNYIPQPMYNSIELSVGMSRVTSFASRSVGPTSPNFEAIAE